MNTYTSYQELIKPSWSPPASLFGPVWTVLYLLIVVSFGWVLYQVVRKQLPALVALPFVLNLIFNLAYTPIQFGLKNNLLASLDILLVLATLIWAIGAILPYSKRLALLQIPYLFWVSFATLLQLTITFLNR